MLGPQWVLSTSQYILATTVHVSPSCLAQTFAQGCPCVWCCFHGGSGGVMWGDRIILTTYGTCTGPAATRRCSPFPAEPGTLPCPFPQDTPREPHTSLGRQFWQKHFIPTITFEVYRCPVVSRNRKHDSHLSPTSVSPHTHETVAIPQPLPAHHL